MAARETTCFFFGLAFKFALKSFLFERFFPDLNRLSSMKTGVVEKEALP